MRSNFRFALSVASAALISLLAAGCSFEVSPENKACEILSSTDQALIAEANNAPSAAKSVYWDAIGSQARELVSDSLKIEGLSPEFFSKLKELDETFLITTPSSLTSNLGPGDEQIRKSFSVGFLQQYFARVDVLCLNLN